MGRRDRRADDVDLPHPQSFHVELFDLEFADPRHADGQKADGHTTDSESAERQRATGEGTGRQRPKCACAMGPREPAYGETLRITALVSAGAELEAGTGI